MGRLYTIRWLDDGEVYRHEVSTKIEAQQFLAFLNSIMSSDAKIQDPILETD